MLKSKVFHRLDLSAEFYQQFNCRNEGLKKRVGFFEIENVRKPNVITIALNPKEYYERFIDHSDNKKHKGIKKSTPGMDFDSYSNRLSDLTEYFNEFLTTDNSVETNLSIYAQTPILYEVNSDTKFLSPDWNTTKELIKNGSRK